MRELSTWGRLPGTPLTPQDFERTCHWEGKGKSVPDIPRYRTA